MGNPEPVFGVHGVRLKNRPDVFKELHFRFAAEDAPAAGGSAAWHWKMADPRAAGGRAAGADAIQLNWNHYNGRRIPADGTARLAADLVGGDGTISHGRIKFCLKSPAVCSLIRRSFVQA